ncbi:MAG: hypothetical protein QXR30_04995 [Candidatus Woesearchaeota archaeon]
MDYYNLKLDYKTKELLHPNNLLKNVDVAKIIYSLSDLKPHSFTEISKYSEIQKSTLSWKLPSLVSCNLLNKKDATYWINEPTFIELFFYWFENQLIKKLPNYERIDVKSYYDELKDNQFFKDILFINMNGFSEMNVPLSGYFYFIISENTYNSLVNPGKGYILYVLNKNFTNKEGAIKILEFLIYSFSKIVQEEIKKNQNIDFIKLSLSLLEKNFSVLQLESMNFITQVLENADIKKVNNTILNILKQEYGSENVDNTIKFFSAFKSTYFNQINLKVFQKITSVLEKENYENFIFEMLKEIVDKNPELPKNLIDTFIKKTYKT